MMAFPEMLVNIANEANIKVPDDLNDYDKESYPYWDIFTKIQLGRPMPRPQSPWSNAKIIASIPENKIKEITLTDLLEKGIE